MQLVRFQWWLGTFEILGRAFRIQNERNVCGPVRGAIGFIPAKSQTDRPVEAREAARKTPKAIGTSVALIHGLNAFLQPIVVQLNAIELQTLFGQAEPSHQVCGPMPKEKATLLTKRFTASLNGLAEPIQSALTGTVVPWMKHGPTGRYGS